MLILKDVSAGYGGPDVVRSVSLEVRAGESLSIIGPNGCGKTTLLRAIAGLLPFRGDVMIDDRSIRGMSAREVSRKIAMLSQLSGVYFSYTVFDTVMMGRYLHIKDRLLGIPSADDKEYVLSCLETVGLLDDRNKSITQLSGGQLQRVFLARTLAQQPEIILLDEPTNHLDLKYQIELIEYLKEWATDGRSVIGVLHDINLAMRLSDNLMLMKDGGIQAIGKTDEVVTDMLLERVYEIDVAQYMRETLGVWNRIGS